MAEFANWAPKIANLLFAYSERWLGQAASMSLPRWLRPWSRFQCEVQGKFLLRYILPKKINPYNPLFSSQNRVHLSNVRLRIINAKNLLF